MMFTVGNVPTINDSERSMKTSDAFLQKVLVKTILKVDYFSFDIFNFIRWFRSPQSTRRFIWRLFLRILFWKRFSIWR